MDPAMGAGIGGSLGILKALSDKTKQDQEKQTREAELRYNPWTHMGFAEMIKPRETDTLGTVVGSAVAGADQGQGFQNAEAQNQYLNARTNAYNKSYGLPMTPAPTGATSPIGRLFSNGFNAPDASAGPTPGNMQAAAGPATQAGKINRNRAPAGLSYGNARNGSMDPDSPWFDPSLSDPLSPVLRRPQGDYPAGRNGGG